MDKIFLKLEKRIYPEWGRSWEAWVKYYIATDYYNAARFLEKEYKLSFKDGVAKKYFPYDDEYEEFTLKQISFEEIPSNVQLS